MQAEAENLLILFGANFWRRPQPQTAFAYLHFVCAARRAARPAHRPRPLARTDRVTRALVVGVLVMLAVGAASPLMIPLGGAHEVAIVLPLGAVLGGRVIGPWLAAGRGRAAGSPGRAGDAGDGGVRCSRAAGLGLLSASATPPPSPPSPPGTQRSPTGWSPTT